MIWIVFFLLILTVSFPFFKQRAGFEVSPTLLIVVSRYNEKMEWLKDPLFSKHAVLIYNKGINQDFYTTGNVIPLENVGREGHTYLHHIINQYDQLPDILVFLPGSVNVMDKLERSKRMMEEIEERKKAVFICNPTTLKELYPFTIEHYSSTSPENLDINNEYILQASTIRPFGKWYKAKFGNRKLTRMNHGGVLSVSKKDILQFPKSYYEDLLEGLRHNSNPEVGHYVERSWQAIFNMKETVLL